MSNGIYSSLSLSLSLCYQRTKEERIGLIPCASPTLCKGGLRLSDESQRLSDAIGGVL